MVNVVIQALLLLCALLVNFVIPVIYGLESYGAFIKANILVFLFQRLTDISTEPLIGYVEAGSIFPLSVALSTLVWMLFVAVDAVSGIGSPALLAAMLLSSCAMLSMHALDLRRLLVVYLLVFLGMFLALLALKEWLHWAFSIESILFWTNLVPAFGASVILVRSGVRRPRAREVGQLLMSVVRMVPGNFSVSLVFNLFTNLLPYIFSKTLPLAELGLFRITTALVQSATTIFPINTKAVFVRLVGSNNRAGHLRILLSWSLLYFAIAGLAALVLASAEARINPYLALLASLPTLYWTVILERYLQATNQRRRLMAANLVVGAAVLAYAFQIESIEEAVIHYAFGFALYAVWLLCLVRHVVSPVQLASVAMLSPVAVWLQGVSLLYSVVYFACLVMFTWIIFRPSFEDVKRLRGTS